jgi:hypothetical protein
MELLITDIYTTSFKAYKKKGYKTYFSGQNSLRRDALYKTLPSPFHANTLRYI